MASMGWRKTMLVYGLIVVSVVVPIALIFLRKPPAEPTTAVPGAMKEVMSGEPVLGLPANLVFGLLALANFLCCVPMAMPTAHLIAFCGDVGLTAAKGAAMLSLLLTCAVVSRQLWGVLSDRINVGGNEGGQQAVFTTAGANTDDTTWAVDGVNITDMSAMASTVSITMEEQNAAVASIAEGVHRASIEAQNGAQAMDRVAGASTDARTTATDVKSLADTLAAEAEKLDTEVRRFLAEVQAA